MAQAITTPVNTIHGFPNLFHVINFECPICMESSFREVVLLHPAAGSQNPHVICHDCAMRFFANRPRREQKCPICRKAPDRRYGLYDNVGGDNYQIREVQNRPGFDGVIPLPASESDEEYDDIIRNAFLSAFGGASLRVPEDEHIARSSLNSFCEAVILGATGGVINFFEGAFELSKVAVSFGVSCIVITWLAFIPIVPTCLLFLNSIYHFIFTCKTVLGLPNKLSTYFDVGRFIGDVTLGLVIVNANRDASIANHVGKAIGQFLSFVLLFSLCSSVFGPIVAIIVCDILYFCSFLSWVFDSMYLSRV